MLIDDLHLLDDASHRIIAGCVSRLHTSRVLLVLASREALATSIVVATRQHITLDVLSADDVALLDIAAGPAPRLAVAPALNASAIPPVTPSRLAKWLTQPVLLRGSPRAIPLVAACGLALVFMMFARHKAGALETLTVIEWRGDSIDTQVLDFRDNDAKTPLYGLRFGRAHWPLGRIPERVRIAPDGETMAVQVERDNLNTMDIIGVRRDSVFDLATGPRDEATPAWSPDGTMLAFSTNRWSPAGNQGCDIAVRDVASKALWRVTEGPDCDEMPVWSSTGDGLAFLRHYRERGDSVAICSIAKASEALHCTPIIRALFVADVVGWRADGDVVIATSHDGSWSLNTLDLATGTLRTLIGHLRYVNAQLSPSTRYVACWCGTDGASANSVTVLDLAGNQPLIELHSPFSSPFRQLAWHAQRAPVQSDRSKVASGFSALDREVMARAAVSLRAHALSRNADTSLDTLAAARALMRNGAALQTVARIPSPLAPATPRLAALHHGPTDRLLLDEEWSRIDSSRWVSFGDPRPRASLALSGFDPAGDGSYPSGVYSREAYAIDSGLVIEAVIRVPITLPYWQQIEFYLNSDTFVRNIGVWNHRTGTWPAVNPENFFETGTKYPALEGADRASLMAVNGAGTTTFRAVPESFADGRDVLMTITWRPDSTMTVTADGQRIAARRYAPPPSRRMHLFIMGHSVESDVRVRALRIWSIGGVR